MREFRNNEGRFGANVLQSGFVSKDRRNCLLFFKSSTHTAQTNTVISRKFAIKLSCSTFVFVSCTRLKTQCTNYCFYFYFSLYDKPRAAREILKTPPVYCGLLSCPGRARHDTLHMRTHHIQPLSVLFVLLYSFLDNLNPRLRDQTLWFLLFFFCFRPGFFVFPGGSLD